jgi:RoxA-like, cytochrome c-like
MTRFDRAAKHCLGLLLAVSPVLFVNEGRTQPAAPTVTYADQGWSAADRDIFYTTSQGSRIMPYAWFKALRRLDVDEPFAADQLKRYGYLPNARSTRNPEGLPVGFVIDANTQPPAFGMTCAACHTTELEYRNNQGVLQTLRVDGAPTHADFQSFLTDLTAALRATLDKPDRFTAFAKAVLGTGYSQAKADQLKGTFRTWLEPFGAFMDKSLPHSPWGPGRLDAFGMIFNRVAGLDLGIKDNVKSADAPVSYPFLWNASKQDRTQWNGGVPNGLFINALGRNTGEVFGVFADFKPKKAGLLVLYNDNSADLSGLQTLEEQIVKLRPPPWPSDLPYNKELAERGEPLFKARCQECHSDRPSELLKGAWETPVKAVGTDSKMATNSERAAAPGVLEGQPVPPPPIGSFLDDPTTAHDVLAVSVVGSLTAALLGKPYQRNGLVRALQLDAARLFPNEPLNPTQIKQMHEMIKANLRGLFKKPVTADKGAAYESRSLHGIWATAPYLHNGSVPSLWELLKPAKDRQTTFMVGSRMFDPKNVGYVTDQSPFNATFVTDPMNANGNGNGGHEYGSDLSEDERWAIVEYLKKY